MWQGDSHFVRKRAEMPRAYTVSLPYDYDFTEYNEVDQAYVFRMRFKEEYYKQFIFLPDNNPNLMKAGRAYLVLVMKGQLDLSATNVTLSDTIADDEQNVVNSFEDWFFDDKFTPVGKWQATFRSISDVEADSRNIYGMRDDGSWARFQSEDGTEQHRLAAFRGYFDYDAPSQSAPGRAAALPGTYKTMLEKFNQQGTNAGEDGSQEEMGYEGDIPFMANNPDGIEPTILTIDPNGTARYFDLQGRMIEGKPSNAGIYVNDKGQKNVIK